MKGNNTVVLMIASFTIFDGLIGAGSNMAILRIAENAIDSYEYVNHMPDINEGNISSLIQNHNIDIKNIGFSYDNRRVLDNVTCIIKENEMTAIARRAMEGKTFELINDGFSEKSGLRTLNAFPLGFRHFYSKKPLKDMADLKGLRMRVPNIPLYINFAKECGISGQPMPFAEVPSALDQGVIDGKYKL